MNTNPLTMYPGVPQNRAVALAQSLVCNPDGTAEQDLLILGKNERMPIVRIAVYDLSGELRYKDEKNTHLMSRANPYDPDQTIWYVSFPSSTFLRNTCKVNVDIGGKVQIFYSRMSFESFIGLGADGVLGESVIEVTDTEPQLQDPTMTTSSSNIAAVLGIEHRELDTFTRTFSFTQNDAPLDISAYVFTFIISVNDVSVKEMTVGNGLLQIVGIDKLVIVNQQLGLAVGEYTHELRALLPNGQTRTLLSGPFIIVNSNG